MAEYPINPKQNVFKKYRIVNYINSYVFAPPVDLTTNTEIGGVASTISTPTLLATKLAIDVSRITNFSIVGSDIKCKITGSYGTPLDAFQLNSLITYYRDLDNLVNAINRDAFDRALNLAELQTKGVVSVGPNSPLKGTALSSITLPLATSIIGLNVFADSSPNFGTIKHIDIRSVTTLGASSGDNSIFGGMTGNPIIYAHPSLQTNNTGGVDGDLAYAISQGATVRYVTNNTIPSPVTNLTTGTIYKTAIQLNFTAPASANALDYYECWANGVLKNEIKNSGEYITGLTDSTSYNITVIAVDIFHNKSLVSNTINQSTNTTSAVPTTGLVSYYKLESSSIDSYGTRNGADTSMTYGVGKVGNSAIFSGSGYIQGSPLFGYTSFTIACWIKTTEAGERIIFSNRVGTSAIIQMAISSGKLVTRIRSSASTGITTFSSISSVNTNTWRHVAMVFDKTTGLQKNYIDGVFENSIAYTGGSFSGFTRSSIGVDANDLSYGKFIGNIDEMTIYNVALTQAEMQLIYNNGNGITL